jgi:hypothetical protein
VLTLEFKPEKKLSELDDRKPLVVSILAETLSVGLEFGNIKPSG